jgi:Nif-specific regulatory protein
MTAKLVAIAGPLKGSVFPLVQPQFIIGRERSSALWIEDHAVSRQHCVIQSEGDQFKIVDLGSLNGIRVNNLRYKEHFLEYGDEIEIGQSLFRFFPGEEPEELPEAELVVLGSTILLRDGTPDPRRMARELEILHKISLSLSTIVDLEALERRLLELIFEAVPAERGAIVLHGKGSEGVGSSFSWDKRPGRHEPMRVSGAVINRVLRGGAGVMTNEVRKTLGEDRTLCESGVCCLLAVPLTAFENTLGLIYLDSSEATASFEEDHLSLLTGIASIAAPALDYLRHVKQSENHQLETGINIEHSMVGQSPVMRRVYEFIAKLAPTDSTVLICGESGTGKELVARAIHRNSPRAHKPFLAINCAALTETLLESELFGHEKGAFTGAVAQKKGKLEEADGGSVFLDEVGELAATLQAKLLRVLQEREFDRVGGTRPVKTDIRLIAATNRDLAEMVQREAFRQDLYYRLNVISLTMPPLRERREDIVPLAEYFVQKHAKRVKRLITGISETALAFLRSYDWPGNVRELENAIERAIVLGSSETILPENLPECVTDASEPASPPGAGFQDLLRESKKRLILRALEQAGGKYTEAAKVLGMHPNNLHRLMRTLNLKERLGE